MYRLTVKGLWAHKLRFALTSLAVVLGVAFMAGTMVLTDTMGKTFDNVFAQANQGTDVVVQQLPTPGAGSSDVRARIPADTLATIRGVDGVAAAEGSIQGFAQLVKADGTVSKTDGLGATLGINWLHDSRLNPFRLASGHEPTTDDEVVLDQATAQREGWAPGDHVTVLTHDVPRTLTLVGTATFGSVGGLPGSSVVAVNDHTAQALFAEPDHYDAVVVSASGATDHAELTARIDQALGHGRYDVVTGEADTASKQSQFKKDLSFFNTFLLVFAYVALFVGTFIIYNTFSIIVAQRTKDTALLRAIGAGRRQVLASVMLESTVVGLLAGALGLGLGIVVSYGLRALLGAVGLSIPAGPTVVAVHTVVTSLVVGMTITVASALAPAIKASRVAPIAALRDVAIDRSGSSVVRTVAGVVVAGAGAALFVAGVVGHGPSVMSLLGLGALTTFIGVFILGPTLARPLVRLLGSPVAAISGATGRLAGENVRRSPKRTSATASALMIGVALVGFITILAASTKASVSDAVDRSFRADYVVDSGTFGTGGLPTTIEADLAARPEVAVVSPLRTAKVGIDGRSADLLAVDTSTIGQLFDLKVSSGSMAATSSGVAVQRTEATNRHLSVGDPVTVTFPGSGAVPLTVSAIYDESLAGVNGSYLVDVSTFAAHVTDQFDQTVYVKTAPGTPAASSRTVLEQVTGQYPNATLKDQASFKEGITKQIDQLLNLIYGLLALAVLIALIGIANTLALSIHERVREIGLLRAVGMTRRQVRTAVRWESVLIALLGTTLGMTLAGLGSWGIVHALRDQSVTTFRLPLAQLGVIVAMAGVAGLVAAMGPARRASRLNVLDAISAD